MKLKSLLAALAIVASLASAHAHANDDANFLDEFDPRAEGAQELLKFHDAMYEEETGESVDTLAEWVNNLFNAGTAGCRRASCKVWIVVKKAEQKAYVYVGGVLKYKWLVSTGTKGHGTPNFDTHPDGRIYNKYTSKKYPGGNYNGLGNMPYAVFIRGGFAIHGTGTGNWKKLGRPASHGCIRLHPNNGQIFNGLVRSVGVRNTWITVI